MTFKLDTSKKINWFPNEYPYKTYSPTSNWISSHCVGLAFCDPMEEFIEIVAKVPPELLKVFRISQLTIRYLLKSQEMLTVSVQNLNNDNEITHKELAKMAKVWIF